MSDDETNKLPDAAGFEQRVMARFDAMETFMQQMSAFMRDTTDRLDRLEGKSYDTKPIWERALAEIVEVKRELREIIRRLDRIDSRTLASKADVDELKDRVESLERKPS